MNDHNELGVPVEATVGPMLQVLAEDGSGLSANVPHAVFSAIQRAYHFNGALHVMGEEEFDAINRSGRCHLLAYMGHHSASDLPTGSVSLMDKRPAPTEPGEFPSETRIPQMRSLRAITVLDGEFIRTNRHNCTITILSHVMGLHPGLIRDYCRAQGMIRPYKMAGRTDMDQLRREYAALTNQLPMPMIDFAAASRITEHPSAYIAQMVKSGTVAGNWKRKMVSLSSFQAHLSTRKAA